MTNNPIIDLLLSILFGGLIASLIFDGHRGLYVRKPQYAIRFVFAYAAFVLDVYYIPVYLSRLFPKEAPLLTVLVISTGITLGCLLMGYGIDRILQRFSWYR